MSRLRRLCSLALVLATLPINAVAAQAAASPCSAAQYHTFDFFLGQWIVKDNTGKLLGSDRVEKTMDGCGLVENWKDASGPGRGFGIIALRNADRKWQQTFLDNAGMVLVFQGQFDGSAILFNGIDFTRKGTRRLHRVAFVPRSDGGLEERWRVSVDGGRTWRMAFDGIFKRDGRLQPRGRM